MTMSGFSGIVKIADLDDFIVPSQECILPVKDLGKETVSNSVKIHMDPKMKGVVSGIDSSGKSIPLPKAQITLGDCLACSGCITTAESILVEQQSHNKITEAADNGIPLVCSISPQSFASLAHHYKVSDVVSFASVLTDFLHNKLNCKAVLSTNLAKLIVQRLVSEDFLKRYEQSKNQEKNLPLLTSSCPGFVCYAEKTHGKWLLPFITRSRSPQAVTGAFIKHSLPSNIFHFTIMPCYDKKLEASRPDFTRNETRETDCVISTLEAVELLDNLDFNMDFKTLKFTLNEALEPFSLQNGLFIDSFGGGSDGYAQFVFKTAAKAIFNLIFEDVDLEKNWVTGRNRDLQELTLYRDESGGFSLGKEAGKCVLRCAKAYGFRNIQNIVTNMKRGGQMRHRYDFIEVMACPRGCLNGGGQIRIDSGEFEALEGFYRNGINSVPDLSIIDDWIASVGDEASVNTDYHAVEPLNLNLPLKW